MLGLGGAGMSALAQFQAMTGGVVSGSDRAFDHGERAGLRQQLERLGIAVVPQDGSGLGPDCAALVVSTAVEEQVADVVAARAHAIPIIHRSELLAHFVGGHRSIAVTGTSGKSTVAAMIFAILSGAGRDPSVITGADLPELQAQGLPGNAFAGRSDLLVVEADESDGSLVRYAPSIGVILNLQRDHKEMTEVAAMFATLRARAREGLVVGDAENLDPFAGGALRFGFSAARRHSRRGRRAWTRLEPLPRRASRVRRCRSPARIMSPTRLRRSPPASLLGVALDEMVSPLAGFRGIGRRFQTRGQGARRRGDRRFRAQCRQDRGGDQDGEAPRQPRARHLSAARLWADALPAQAISSRPSPASSDARDRLWMLEVFYAGGTATRDFSAADIVAEIGAHGANAEFAPSREWLVARIAEAARPGDLVLVMGARDPSLSALARTILAAIDKAAAPQPAK